jgi:kinesin family protein 3/17
MMAMISPALESFTESLSTLKFANRAKHIKNTAHINEDLDQKSLLRKYERELKRLRQELDERTKNLVDKRALLQIEEQRRKAEADKMRAITELEQRSKEFLKEKKERSELEQRINEMQSQLLGGGAPAPDRDSDEFKAVLREEQERVKAEYEGKIRELEADRQEAEEGRAQVGRYKAVLLKQRDIMIALTARLNERDETIIRMQEELKAYDSEYRRVEDALDAKTAELIALRRAAMQQNADSPHRNRDLVDALGGWAGSGTTPRAKSLGMDGKGNSSRVGGAHEVTLNGDDYADSDGSDGAGRRNIEAGRAKLMELQYDQFRAEMASRLEEKNRKIQTMEEENARLRVDTESRTKQADAEAPGRELHAQAVTHAKEQVHQLSEKVDGFTRERAALKTILESKMSTLVDGIARSFEELGDDGRRHPRLAREISALDRLVTATVHAMEF